MCKQIMIVDDSSHMRMMLRKILTKHGHSVVCEAENGIKAVSMYILFKPELVLMDITMPEMNGIEALAKILAIDPSAKVVIISSVISSEPVEQALKVGALDFIAKPFSVNRLIQAVERNTLVNK